MSIMFGPELRIRSDRHTAYRVLERADGLCSCTVVPMSVVNDLIVMNMPRRLTSRIDRGLVMMVAPPVHGQRPNVREKSYRR